MNLTFDILNRRWPNAPHALTEGLVASSAAVFEKYGLTTSAEQADLLAQISEETGGGTATEENLNYSAGRLCQVWPTRFHTLGAATPFAHSPQALANNVYNGRGGNRVGSNDGWLFRGRGGLQTTFHDNYLKTQELTGLAIMDNPGLLSDPAHILECAAAFWKNAGLNKDADSGNFSHETLVLNGGLTNLALREQWRNVWRQELCG